MKSSKKHLSGSKQSLSMFLKFRDKETNEKFGSETLKFQKNCFKTLVGTLIILSAYPSLIAGDKGADIFKSTFLPALSILVCFSFYYSFVMRYLSKFIEIFICVLVAFVVIFPMEFVDRKSWNPEKMHFFSSALQLIIMFPIILRVSWRRYTPFIIALQAYFSLRDFSFNKMKEMNMHPVVAFTIHSMILVLVHYTSERELKRQFNSSYLQECTVAVYKTMLTEIIPSAAIIVKGNEIIFANDATSNILANLSNAELKGKLNEIRVKANTFQDTNPHLLTDMELIYSSKHCIPDLEGFVDLNDLIKEYQTTKRYSKTAKFNFYQGFMRAESNELVRNPKKVFDIQIGDFFWDKEKVTLVLLSDVSANMRIQYLKTVGEYKDKLLATVSHDLRTPLNGIIGMLEIAFENLLERPVERKLLNLSMKSANLLLYMINDILDYSQITSGKLRLNFETIDILSLIKDVSKLIKFQAKKKFIDFKLINNASPGINLICNTDGNRIKQVLLNLLGNALKFTSKGYIKVELSRRSNLGPVNISVEDTGIGIKPEDQGKLFKLFGKLEQSDRNINKSGVGLGLAVSQSIVKMINENKGEITVQSEFGKGSLFQFPIYSKSSEVIYGSQEILITEEDPNYHSIRVVEYNSNTICTMDEIIEFQNKEKKRILIVDDDQINIMVEVNFLISMDYCYYDIVYNGKEAIDKILEMKEEKKFYDVILMDCNMPVMDGFQASRIIKEMVRRNEIPSLNIIAVTANASETDRKICEECGMDNYVTKPLRKNELCSLIFKICYGDSLV